MANRATTDEFGRERARRFLFLKLLWRNRSATIGLAVVLVALFVALTANSLAPYDPYAQNLSVQLEPPSRDHLLGTDQFGRDMLSRLLWGARISLGVGVISVFLANAVGVPLGIMAGFRGGAVDTIIMRVMDALFALPTIVVAILIVAVLGPGLRNAMIAISIVYIPYSVRFLRAPALVEANKDYVLAARAIGATERRILFRHVTPNCMSIVIVRLTICVAWAILDETALSFLGLGAPPPTASWGRMLNDARGLMELAPWTAIFPGLAIALVVAGFNLLGDGLGDILNPSRRR